MVTFMFEHLIYVACKELGEVATSLIHNKGSWLQGIGRSGNLCYVQAPSVIGCHTLDLQFVVSANVHEPP